MRVLGAFLVATALAPVQGRPAEPRAAALLRAYDRAEFADVDAGLAALTDLGAFLDALHMAAIERARGELSTPSLPFVERVRLVGASLALEAAQRRGQEQPAAAIALVEWGCRTLRLSPEPQAGELAWFHASLALFEGMAASSALEVHSDHAIRRFPNEPAVVLARAVSAEVWSFPDTRSSQTFAESEERQYTLLVYRLRQAQKYAPVHAEASVRLAYTFIRAEKFKDADETLRRINRSETPARLLYLADLFHGRALERLGRPLDAIAAYRSAVAVVPDAQTAAIALAAALARAGDRAEAASAAALAVASRAPTLAGDFAWQDPWLSYGQGDLPIWPDLILRVRDGVRR